MTSSRASLPREAAQWVLLSGGARGAAMTHPPNVRSPRSRAAALLLIVIATLVAPATSAAAACPKTSQSAVESQVMCLQCGVPLQVAENAPSAEQERALISAQVAQCRSADQIKQALVAQYGDRVLALPRPSGFGLAAYVVPALGILAAAAAVGVRGVSLATRSPAYGGGRARGRTAGPGRRRRGTPRGGPRALSDLMAGHADTTVIAAFAVGFVSFISPCVLPLVPGYLSAISGVSFAELSEGRGRMRVLGPSLVFCLSFTVMFVALGMSATGLGRTLTDHRDRAARDRRDRDHRDGRALPRNAVRAPPEPRVAAAGAPLARVDGRPGDRRARLRDRLAALHRPDARRDPDRRRHRVDRREGRRPARLLRRRVRRTVHPQRGRLLARSPASSASSATTTGRSRSPRA